MLEFGIIQTRGFTNVVENGAVTGFTLLLRMPNYRGAWGSLIDGVDVTVDGHAFPRESVRWTLRGRTYSLQDLQSSTGVHWDLDAPAVITVPLEGGLSAGVHDVAVTFLLRSPSIPGLVLPWRFRDGRQFTFVRHSSAMRPASGTAS